MAINFDIYLNIKLYYSSRNTGTDQAKKINIMNPNSKKCEKPIICDK